MYGVAATLYTLLTGNPPDRMGRSAFLWPAQGMSVMTQQEQADWKEFHAVIGRATQERVSERYPDFAAMAAAIQGDTGKPAISRQTRSSPFLRLTVVCILLAVILGALLSHRLDNAATSGVSTGLAGVKPSGQSSHDKDVNRMANSAYNVFTSIDRYQHLRIAEILTPKDNSNHLEACGRLSSCILDVDQFNLSKAISAIEVFQQSSPRLRDQPTVVVAKLLLQAANGERREVDEYLKLHKILTVETYEYEFPAFGLCELGRPDVAETFLTEYMGSPSCQSNYDKCSALAERANSKVIRNDFAAARADLKLAINLARGDETAADNLNRRIRRIEFDHAEFAAYARGHPLE